MEFFGDGVPGLFVGGVVVVFEEFAAAAVDTTAVAFFDDPFLACGGVSAAV